MTILRFPNQPPPDSLLREIAETVITSESVQTMLDDIDHTMIRATTEMEIRDEVARMAYALLMDNGYTFEVVLPMLGNALSDRVKQIVPMPDGSAKDATFAAAEEAWLMHLSQSPPFRETLHRLLKDTEVVEVLLIDAIIEATNLAIAPYTPHTGSP